MRKAQPKAPRKDLKFHRSLTIASVAVFLSFVISIVRLYFSTDGVLGLLTFPDEYNYYLAGAEEFLRNGWDYFLTPRSLWNGPINILWVAIWHSQIPVVKIINAALLSLCGLIVWDMTRRLFGNRAGAISAVLFSLHPALSVFGPTILTEPLFIFFVCLSVWLFAFGEEDTWAYFCSGLAMGIAILIRPTAEFYPLLVILLRPVVIILRPQVEVPPLSRLGLFFAGAYLLVGAQIIKNVLYLDTARIANGFGAVLYVGNDLRKDGDEPVYSHMDFDTFDITYPMTHLDTEGDRKLIDRAVTVMRAFPADTLLLTGRKVVRALFGNPEYYFFPFNEIRTFTRHSGIGRIALSSWEMILVCAVSIFALIGLLTLTWGAYGFLIAVFAFYMIALHAIAFPIPRLLLPVFPFFVVFASGLISRHFTQRNYIRLLACSFLVFPVLAFQCCYRLFDKSEIVSDRYTSFFNPRLDLTAKKPSSLHQLDGEVGVSEVSVRGDDPYLVYKMDGFRGQKNDVVFVDLTALSPSQECDSGAQIFWRGADDASFDELRSNPFTIELDRERHIYRIIPSLHPAWQRDLAELRVDLPAHCKGGTFKINRLWIAR